MAEFVGELVRGSSGAANERGRRDFFPIPILQRAQFLAQSLFTRLLDEGPGRPSAQHRTLPGHMVPVRFGMLARSLGGNRSGRDSLHPGFGMTGHEAVRVLRCAHTHAREPNRLT